MADSTADVVAVNLGDVIVGDNGTLTAQAGTTSTPNTNTATGTTVAGTATVTADTVQQVGLLDSTVVVGNAGTFNVSEVSTNTASGTSVDGIATVNATYSSNTGGILDVGTAQTNEVQIGAAGVVAVTVDNTNTATATSTAGDSAATSDFTLGSFGILDSDVTAGAGATLSANLDANAVASATSVGTTAAPADATATASFTKATGGIYASTAGASDITIGSDGSLTATAGVTADPLSLSATAVTTTGNADANATATEIVGIG